VIQDLVLALHEEPPLVYIQVVEFVLKQKDNGCLTVADKAVKR